MVLPMHEKIQRFVYTFFYLTPLLLTLISCQSEQIPELNLPTPPRGVVVPKEMVYIPEGEFIMGHPDHNKTVRGKKVYTHAYLIDKFEVTNEQYKKFDSTYRYPQGQNNYPATYISYNMAVLYLDFVGKRLPIEAEWEKAARGTDGRMFPWGDKVFGPPNYGFSGLVTELVGKRKALVSPFGAYDMVGNVWEWTADWFDSQYYSSAPDRDPQGPVKAEDKPFFGRPEDVGTSIYELEPSKAGSSTLSDCKVLRGGSWNGGGVIHIRCANRDYDEPDYKNDTIGFRCAGSSI